ncbi:MAG TPA: lamin tail domain-containing protein, partial [Candidatus Dormibacteraeota bacterium]|nr:lamin tail domain-containing protein [Candidatus Dormibacteraeota bacterium]
MRITEIMYHPPDPEPGSPFTQDDFEFIEFTNVGNDPLNLNRFRLRGGVDFDFGEITLSAGQSGVLVHNQSAFTLRYGAGAVILGVYTNDNLSNGGENLKLFGAQDEPILNFSYHDNWYPATDGAGFSLVIVNPNAPVSSWGLKESWRPSGTLNGTPGAPDPAVSIPAIVINEISTHNAPPNFDAIELYNPTAAAVNVGGWYLTDEFDTPKKYRIPDGTSIPANGYFVFYATNQANPALAFGRAFGLGSGGGEVYLYSANPATSNLTGYAQGFDFGAQASGVTFGRYVISTGGDQYPTMSSATLGSANSGPKVGPVVISEISYHPPDIQFTYRAVDNCIDEYIELQNTSGAPVPLY